MSFEVHGDWEPWPAGPGDAGLLAPGSAVLGVYRDGELTVLMRRWVGERTRWWSRWPSEDSGPEPQVPTMFFADGSDAREARVLVEQRGLDGEDRLLTTAALRAGEPPRWLQDLPSGPEGRIIEAMAEVVATAWAAPVPDALPDDQVVSLPGPRLAEVHDDLAQRSWHLAHQGRSLRALEAPPIRDADSDVVRARRAWLIDGSSPLSGPGYVIWGDGEVRLWRSGEHPLLDRPVPLDQLRPSEALLVEHLHDGGAG